MRCRLRGFNRKKQSIDAVWLYSQGHERVLQIEGISRLHLGVLVLLCQVVLPQESVDFRRPVNLRLGPLLSVERQGGEFHCKKRQPVDGSMSHKSLLTLLATEGCAVHGLAHHPQDEGDRVLYANVLLVLLLQQALRRAAVSTNAGCFPAGIVA